MYRGFLTVRKVCVLVMNLPRGAQTWVAVGGGAAITSETESSWLIEHALYAIAHAQGGGTGEAPKVRDYPPGLGDLLAKAEYALSRAEAFKQKHMKK